MNDKIKGSSIGMSILFCMYLLYILTIESIVSIVSIQQYLCEFSIKCESNLLKGESRKVSSKLFKSSLHSAHAGLEWNDSHFSLIPATNRATVNGLVFNFKYIRIIALFGTIHSVVSTSIFLSISVDTSNLSCQWDMRDSRCSYTPIAPYSPPPPQIIPLYPLPAPPHRHPCCFKWWPNVSVTQNKSSMRYNPMAWQANIGMNWTLWTVYFRWYIICHNDR